MPSTFTPGLQLELQATGENENTWGVLLNNVISQIDRAVAGVFSLDVTGGDDVTLTDEQSENHLVILTGTLSASINLIVPSDERHYIVFNTTSGAFTLTVKTSTGTGALVEQGQYDILYCDATNVIRIPLVYETKTQTLTNKSFTAPVLTGLSIADTEFTIHDEGDVTKKLQFQLSGITTATTRTLTAPDVSDTLAGLTAAQTLTNKTLDNTNTLSLRDDRFSLQDNGDATKLVVFQVSGVTTATTRTWTFPDTDDTFVGRTTAQTLTNKTLTGNLGAVPVGAGMDWWGGTAPTGWLIAAGQAVSRTTYAALFGVYSTTYGAGDGSTTFNLPDKRGRVTAGIDTMNGSDAGRLSGDTSINAVRNSLGGAGGAGTVQLSAAQMPSHTHTVTGFTSRNISLNDVSLATYTAGSGTAATSSSAGSDAAHNNVQPTIIANYIIYAGA